MSSSRSGTEQKQIPTESVNPYASTIKGMTETAAEEYVRSAQSRRAAAQEVKRQPTVTTTTTAATASPTPDSAKPRSIYDYQSAIKRSSIPNIDAKNIKKEYLRNLRQGSALDSAVARAVTDREKLKKQIADQKNIVDEKGGAGIEISVAEQSNVRAGQRKLSEGRKKQEEKQEAENKLAALKKRDEQLQLEIGEMLALKNQLEQEYKTNIKPYVDTHGVPEYNFGFSCKTEELKAGTDPTQLMKNYEDKLHEGLDGDARIIAHQEEVKPAKDKETVKSFKTNHPEKSDFNATCLQYNRKGVIETVLKQERSFTSHFKGSDKFREEVIQSAIMVVECDHTARGNQKMVFAGNWNLLQLEAAVKYCSLMGYDYELAPGLERKYLADHSLQITAALMKKVCKQINEQINNDFPDQAPLTPVYRIPEEPPKPREKPSHSWFKRRKSSEVHTPPAGMGDAAPSPSSSSSPSASASATSSTSASTSTPASSTTTTSNTTASSSASSSGTASTLSSSSSSSSAAGAGAPASSTSRTLSRPRPPRLSPTSPSSASTPASSTDNSPSLARATTPPRGSRARAHSLGGDLSSFHTPRESSTPSSPLPTSTSSSSSSSSTASVAHTLDFTPGPASTFASTSSSSSSSSSPSTSTTASTNTQPKPNWSIRHPSTWHNAFKR